MRRLDQINEKKIAKKDPLHSLRKASISSSYPRKSWIFSSEFLHGNQNLILHHITQRILDNLLRINHILRRILLRLRTRRWWNESTTPSAGFASAASSLHLPDVFSHVKIYIPEGDEAHAQLVRFFIAFDGNVLEAHERAEATHVLTDVDLDADVAYDGTVKRVTSEWVWHSIRKRTLLDVEAYLV